MVQGQTEINSLGDDTYDGKFIPSSRMLIDGLGQLSDGITGSEDISLVNHRQPWIGWSNQTNSHVSINFEFDSIRQINRVTIHTSNLFSKDIFIFKMATVSFAVERNQQNFTNVVVYEHHRDDVFEIARPILIELNNNVAKFVRLDLYFDSTWILISEVTFDSQPYIEKSSKKLTMLERNTFKPTSNVSSEQRKRHREMTKAPSIISTTITSPVLTIELSLAFVIGASLAVTLLLIGSLLWIVGQKKKLKFQK